MIARLPITVATCGSVNVDITAFCDRLPRPGETVTGERYTIALGGKGANQAAAVARLGARSIFVGRTGTDSFAALARRRLAELGVELDHLASDPSASTGVAVIDVDRRAENSIIVIGGANLAVSAADIDAAKPALQLARVLLLQLETPLAASLAAARLMRSAGGVVILDPAPAPVGGLDDEVLRAVDIVSPNETETEIAGGDPPDNLAGGGGGGVSVIGARRSDRDRQDGRARRVLPQFRQRGIRAAVPRPGGQQRRRRGLLQWRPRGGARPRRFAARRGAVRRRVRGRGDDRPGRRWFRAHPRGGRAVDERRPIAAPGGALIGP